MPPSIPANILGRLPLWLYRCFSGGRHDYEYPILCHFAILSFEMVGMRLSNSNLFNLSFSRDWQLLAAFNIVLAVQQ